MRQLGPLILLFIAGCLPPFSGSSLPVESPTPLSEADIVYAKSTDCLHEITGDPAQDLASVEAFLNERAVRIQELKKDIWPFATALRGRVLVPQGFNERTAASRAALLNHERVHYCERDQFEGNDFERAYAKSTNRFRFEIPAYRMSVRVMKAQGKTDAALCKYINHRVERLRDGYLLWDLEPEQYEAEARRILALDLDSGECPSP